ncbi:hypothetical protein HZD82_27235, partial [Pantoea agglomerans]|nr:hypothetical protein [Pantoea agglomerans]
NAQIAQQEAEGETLVVLMRNGEALGALALRDQLRDDAVEAQQNAQIAQQEAEGETLVVLMRNGEALGALALRDQLRDDAV